MSSSYTATDAEAYQRLMGRWSVLLADELIAFAGIGPRARVLDLGCGTGSLAQALAARSKLDAVIGVDLAPAYLDFARGHSSDPRLHFVQGDALALDFAQGSFDAALSLLALNFMSDPARAIGEMRRVTRTGGIVAAAVWDFAGGLVYQRLFWDTAAALDPAADRFRARLFASPLTQEGEIEAAFRAAGLRAVEAAELTIRMRYAHFADYWRPIANAEGPIGDYVKHLSPDRLIALEAALRRAYGAGREDGPRSMSATAWAAKSRV
jgi:ubiquinone/menaquinone biosynthesis C-methylase UbiE